MLSAGSISSPRGSIEWQQLPEAIMKNVLIPTKLNPVAKDILESKGYSVIQDSETPLTELISRHPDTEALIVRSEKVTEEIIDGLPKLALVVRAGAGYNTIDIKHARRKGVDVMNTPGANSNGVAEEVFALALAAYRHIIPGDTSTRAGLWEKKKLMGRELAGKTLGIVGLGNIGQLVAKRSQGFEMRLLGYDPIISAERAAEAGVKLVSLGQLFAEADVISLHVPENDETRGMVNRQLLSTMKDGAMIVNCARAGIINEDDLRAVRAEKNILFCNDVYPADEAGEKSVADIADVMLPHLGANTHEANYNAARRAAEQIVEYAEQGVTKYVVNKGVPDQLDERFQRLAYYIGMVARRYVGDESPVEELKCSFYGELNQFAKWFMPPICAALSREFDAHQDPEEAETHLEARGIDVEIRNTDADKDYGNSMTIDLACGDSEIRRVSVRGTIAEGNLVVSRINDFDKLYLEAKGNSLVVVYKDRPGVLAQLTSACANLNINIDEIRSLRDSSETNSIAILRTNRPLPAEAVTKIGEEVKAQVIFTLSLT
jgi:D-3-phosphoglycerate dehydrogenase